MTALGMIVKDTKYRNGVEYYRLMTFLEILSILLYGFVFVFLLKDSARVPRQKRVVNSLSNVEKNKQLWHVH